MMASFMGVLVGLLVGARHALEPDHLAAVSVLSAEAPDARRGALLGAFWGAGHTFALVVVAFVLSLFSAKMPDRLAGTFEFIVAGMLVGLGVRAIVRSIRTRKDGPPFVHRHRTELHTHQGERDHFHLGDWTLATRPLFVGAVHGLAGSGSLTALAMAELPSFAARIAFVVFFGLGSVLGMSALSGLAGYPLARLAKTARAGRLLSLLTGVFSTLFGIAWGFPLAQHLLL